MMDVDSLIALCAAMRKYPGLTINGLDGDRRPEYEERRIDLVAAVDEFDRAVAWLSLVPKRAIPNRECGHSYGLKHIIQDWAGVYVSNGATIAAAASLGFPILQCPSGINVWIGVAGRRKWPKPMTACRA
jgi:hypothetical protein